MSARTFFVTGTDTEVGKTFVSCILLKTLNSLGMVGAAFKPVAAGVEEFGERECNPDTEALKRFSLKQQTHEQITPFFFREAIAPHLAAKQSKTELSIHAIHQHFHQHFNPEWMTLIEGAGGWEVPLNDKESFAELALSFKCPIFLVVDIKLGCINHALLTAHRIRNQNGQLTAWIANNHRDYSHARENIDAIKERIDLPCLGEIPNLNSLDEGTAFIDKGLLAKLLK